MMTAASAARASLVLTKVSARIEKAVLAAISQNVPIESPKTYGFLFVVSKWSFFWSAGLPSTMSESSRYVDL